MRRLLKILLLLSLSSTAFALPSDSQKTLHIIADSSVFNFKTGENLYEGSVNIDQGTQHLTADRVTTKSQRHMIQVAVAYGIHQLAEYQTVPTQGDGLLLAKANVITFYPAQSLIRLEGNAIVTQGQDSFRGSVIFYNTKTQIITAPAEKNNRAFFVVEPEQVGA